MFKLGAQTAMKKLHKKKRMSPNPVGLTDTNDGETPPSINQKMENPSRTGPQTWAAPST